MRRKRRGERRKSIQRTEIENKEEKRERIMKIQSRKEKDRIK